MLNSIAAITGVGTSGMSFTSATVPSPTTNPRGVYFLNSQFILTGNDASSLPTIATGTNGATWSNQTLTNAGTVWPTSLAFGTSTYVMITDVLKSSTNLTTWTDRTTVLGSDRAVVWDGTNAKFIGVGVKGAASFNSMYSTNGTSWTGSTTTGTTFNALGTSAGTTVAVGTAGSMMTSTNATTWTVRTSSFGSTNINAVANFNSLWIAVGESGTLATSSDAITWTQRTSTFGTTQIKGIGFYNGRYYIVGLAGKIASSTDGTTWTAGAPYSSNDMYSLTQNTTGLFVTSGVFSVLGYWQGS